VKNGGRIDPAAVFFSPQASATLTFLTIRNNNF